MENKTNFNETDELNELIAQEDAEEVTGEVVEEPSKAKKTLLKIKDIVTWVIFGVAILVMIFTIVSSIFFNTAKGEDKSLFGLKFYIVLTDSMKEDIEKGTSGPFASGDLIIGTEIDPKTIQPGDIITFVNMDADVAPLGSLISHKVRDKAYDDDGKWIGFITYGTTTGTDDDHAVEFGEIRARYAFTVPFAGHFFNFLKTTPGYIVCILIPFILIIALQIVNFVKVFRQYKSEQISEMREERLKLEEDKQANAKMMEELLALKAELERAKAQAAGEDAPPKEESDSN